MEREAVRPQQAAGDLRQAAEAGLQFFRMLDAAEPDRLRPVYLRQYALAALPAAAAYSHPISAVVAGRVIDGIKLHADLVAAGSAALPAATRVEQRRPAGGAADRAGVAGLVRIAVQTSRRARTSWSPDRMEYAFVLGSASGATQCVAREYDGGGADWYTFDRAAAMPATGGRRRRPLQTRYAMAAPVTFRGMPARRFWEMEDAAVDIGALSAAAEDIGRLLLREFALIYGNDWFQVPLLVPVGSEITVNMLTVTDTFGLTTPIPHYTDVDGAGGGWRMFALTAGRRPRPRRRRMCWWCRQARLRRPTAPRSRTSCCCATSLRTWRGAWSGRRSAPRERRLIARLTWKTALPPVARRRWPARRPPTGWDRAFPITGFRSCRWLRVLVRYGCGAAGCRRRQPAVRWAV